jgi:hypothetical protein
MRMKRSLLLLALAAIAVLGLQYTAVGQGITTAITSSLEGALRPLHVALVNPATDALVAYVTDARGAGATNSDTLRTATASDSPEVATLGATGDAAATAGSTGSLSAKLRLLTSQVADAVTALQAIDDDQTGGTECPVVSAASTNATNCKASPGRVLGIYLLNTTTTTYYLRTYNLSTSPTCSSATGFRQSYPIPPATAAGQVGGFSFPMPPAGIAFGTGIGFCLTGGSDSTNNTNAATGVFGTIVYK